MSEIKAIFLYSPKIESIRYPEDCPFKTERVVKLRKKLLSMGLLGGSNKRVVEPPDASREELEKFHAGVYLDAVIAAEKGDLTPIGLSMGIGTPDCPVFIGMYDYMKLAAGGSLTGARLLLNGEADVVFNPAGGLHHAAAAAASGFCYVNDVVLAAMEFTAAGKKVLFLDLDVHHGDGMQDAFYQRKDVMTISLHESGKTLFPGNGFENETGLGDGEGYSVNIPLPIATYDEAYKRAFREAALPLMKAYDPDVLILELGMDALSGDPLANLNLTNNAYADILEDVKGLHKPILALGGGGYNTKAAVRSWALCWSVLCGEEEHDMAIGLGGVMMESTEWAGGLRDRTLITPDHVRTRVDAEINTVIKYIKEHLFPLHIS